MFPPAVCVDLAAERSDSGPIASGRRVEAPAKGVVAQVAESFAQGTRYDNLTILEAEVGRSARSGSKSKSSVDRRSLNPQKQT
jgi:hypothetical protein